VHARYWRILTCFWKNSLIREMTFRGHFVLNVLSELGWFILLMIFVKVIFSHTSNVRGWDESQYLFLLGTHMMVTSIFETFFVDNLWRVSQLVRSGDLDFVLLRPASTQFLLSFERVDLSPIARIPVALVLCGWALSGRAEPITAGQVGLFMVTILGGVMILYSLMFAFAITSVWLIRQTGVDHLWFYAVSLARYPADIYRRFLGGILYFVFVFIIPILMVSNLPANVMVRTFEPWMVVYLLVIGVVLVWLSTVACRFALKWYRSASS